LQKRLDTIAFGLVKVANSAARSDTQKKSGEATSLSIFGFKVGEKTYSNLSSDDVNGFDT
jgi:hypothetical protein